MTIFKTLPGYNNRYHVSNDGEVLDTITNQFRRKRLRKDRYYDVALFDGKKWVVKLSHRLVLMAFKGMPQNERPLARHLDGSKTNNTPDNLEWGTYKENRADRRIHGTHSTGVGNIGEKSKSSVLKDKDVIEIKHLLKHTKMFHKEIASMYGVQREAVNKISLGKRWKHIQLC